MVVLPVKTLLSMLLSLGCDLCVDSRHVNRLKLPSIMSWLVVHGGCYRSHASLILQNEP